MHTAFLKRLTVVYSRCKEKKDSSESFIHAYSTKHTAWWMWHPYAKESHVYNFSSTLSNGSTDQKLDLHNPDKMLYKN